MYVLLFTRRIATAALIFLLSAGGSALCAGWEATPQARMACCTDDGACPMHKSEASGSTRVVSQAEADSCCAASERGDSTPSASSFVPVVSLGPVVGSIAVFALPARFSFEAWRAVVHLPGSQVPKHLLLSVFLI